MSFTDTGENCKEQFEQSEGKSLDPDTEKQTDNERDSDESVSESIIKLKIIPTEKNHKRFGTGKNSSKIHVGRLNMSRYGKYSRYCTKRNKSRKQKERRTIKKGPVKSQHRLGNSVEVTTIFDQKGKRCRLGGKAKGIPPSEETCEKYESDEETDNSYFSRISLGYFQKFKDKSGASTSHQLEESYKSPSSLLTRTEELLDKTSEEMELLELQQWGRVNLVSPKGIEKLDITKDIGPDTF